MKPPKKPPSPPSKKDPAIFHRAWNAEVERMEERTAERKLKELQAKTRKGRPVGTHGAGVGDPHESTKRSYEKPGRSSLASPKRYRPK
jgi:hypothetical protein